MAPSLRQVAYDAIKDKIIACHFAPGDIISEGILIDEINVSRTPIREALRQLEQERFVRILPKKGVIVTDISLADINAIFEVRSLIEPHILREHLDNIDAAAIRGLRREFDSITLADKEVLYGLDDAFHQAIYRACSNPYLVSALEQVYAQNQRLRVLSGSVARRLESSNAEHNRIIDAILAGDAAGAADAMVEHLRNSKAASFDQLMSRRPA
ncbi:MAG: GntR family transcriptional regulator [Propionibacteriaceae bacterium]|jgi:DNA-binding GntR family transcriptional regulator|nr:GntR family transcriptional regulator [Propionibacteriaceae bacterium]